MEIIINSKNIEVSSHLRQYAEKKFKSACRFIPEVVNKEKEDQEKTGDDVERVLLEVEIEKTAGKEKGRIFRVEGQLKIPGRVIKAESVSETTKESIDKVKDEIERQVKEHKEKMKTQEIKGGQKAKRLRG